MEAWLVASGHLCGTGVAETAAEGAGVAAHVAVVTEGCGVATMIDDDSEWMWWLPCMRLVGSSSVLAVLSLRRLWDEDSSTQKSCQPWSGLATTMFCGHRVPS
ncbi:hypothetical protein SETIT_5G163500v2 [Setaria italica]|uniref:Uncharacterized protein n=1 Tax=Setaria italica TaxID=4555 RepID=K3XNI6_SETIT|nr:hypothetical protein SETIT_5G163500v2 [Setaria italica]